MSEKIAIVTDSNSGITQEQAKELGIFVIPMPFLIGENTYFEGINLSQHAFYQKLGENAEISTSQPIVGDILNLWDGLLKNCDSIVHIPMSSGLSGSCATANMLAADYDGRVCVVDNQRISVTQRQSVLDAVTLRNAGKTAAEIREILEKCKFESSIYIMMDTLKYLKKGGRITPAAAAIATVLRIKPVLQIQGEKLDAYAKARSVPIARETMIEAMRKDANTRFGGVNKLRLFVAHTNNEVLAEEFAAQVRSVFNVDEIYIDNLSLSVSCHIGPGALAIACSKRIEAFL